MNEQTTDARPRLTGVIEYLAPGTFAVIGMVTVVVFLVWIDHDGGYAPEQWLPGGLLFLGLLAALCAAADARRRIGSARLPVALLAAYALFSYVSIAWSGSRGDAVDGANRTALYAVVFTVFVALPRRHLLLALPGVWAAGVVVEGLAHFFQATTSSGPRGFFIIGRLSSPITYSDAEAAVLLMAAVALTVVAASRSTPMWMRAAAAALACAGADLAILAQSRGSLVALPVALVILLCLSRNPLRVLATLAVFVAAVAPATPALLHVYTAVVGGTGYGETLRHARLVVMLGMAGAAAGVACIAAFDARHSLSPRLCRTIRRVLVASAALATAATVVLAFALTDPAARARQAWSDFTTNTTAPLETIHLASGVGTSRYDVWRIALRQFAAHPVGGVGADNYLAGYLRDRRTVETARYPESVVLRAFSETGLAGALLFFGFLASAGVLAVRRLRSEPPLAPTMVGLAASCYWLVHASVDWFWEFPALTGPAVAFLGLACATSETGTPLTAVPRRTLASVSALACLGVAAAFLCSWIAVRKIDLAVSSNSPSRAYALLREAERWNPFSDQPQLTEAAIAANDLDRPREAAALHAALRKNSADWYAHLMLGVVAGREHRARRSAAELRRARDLSPLEPVVIYAQSNLRVGNPLTEQEIAAVIALRDRLMRGVDQR